MANFRPKVLAWDGAVVLMKNPGNLIGKLNLTKCEMKEFVTKTEEPD